MAKIIFCACREYGHIAGAALHQLTAAARDAGHDIEVLDDLCHSAAKEPLRLADLATADAVVACHPRVVRGLFARCACSAPVQLLNARCEAPAVIAAALGLGELPTAVPTTPASVLESSSPDYVPADGWIAWYPVVDYERCVTCGKCVDFCMFGTYTRDNQGVRVTQPDACKTNCPACARMCPTQAIMFPKIKEEPYNGAEPSAGKTSAAASRPGGLLDTLRTRNAVKKRLFKDGEPS